MKYILTEASLDVFLKVNNQFLASEMGKTVYLLNLLDIKRNSKTFTTNQTKKQN